MSEDNAPSRGEEKPPEPRRDSTMLGVLAFLVGTIALYALYFGTTAGIAPDQGYRTFLAGPAAFIPIGVYLAVAGVLAIRPRTSSVGAGMLIGLGVFVLMGGGICVLSLAQMSRRI